MPNITKRYIDAARYESDGKTRDERWDDGLRGFGLRISPKGVKTFILFYRVGGKRGARQRLVKLGTYGRDMTPDEARRKAGRWLTAARDGHDPYGEIDEAAKSDTFKAVAADFIELSVVPNQRPRGVAEDKRIINVELVPKWGPRRIREITSRDVINLLDDIAARPAPIMANRTLAVTRKLFKWATARHALDQIPTDGIEPPGKETKRDRVLTDGEIRLVWQASDTSKQTCGSVIKALILTGGADYNRLGVPGEEELIGKGVSYCATCDAAFFKDQEVAVVGGGDAAVEEAMFAARFASKVTLIHRRDELRAGRILQERIFANPKMEFLWNTVVTAIKGDNEVTALSLNNRVSGEDSSLSVAALFIFIGQHPNTDFLNGLVAMDNGKHVQVDEWMATGLGGLFAAGDVRQNSARQVASSAGDGVTAAIAADHYISDNFPD
ncbi:MAG: FAD-dependent oxidoreductase [Chloroflexi bacterium]|nr:FAD-dependent oxidoreductase [Chloroflexota bacterium]